MNYYFITGVSGGIGLALAQELEKLPDSKVIGLGRKRGKWEGEFLTIDLSDPGQLIEFRFSLPEDISSVNLINNAGQIGDIHHSGNIDPQQIIQTVTVNLTAPHILVNRFLKDFSGLKKPGMILNIGSGAAVNPIDGWSTYCASKAALDMLTRVVAKEFLLDGSYFRIFSVYPGIVDTEMQGVIRSADDKGFSRVDDFRAYKSKGELLKPEFVAEKLVRLLFKDKVALPEVFALRDY